jgi:hypothetical protein
MKVFPLAGSLVAEGCFVTSLTAPGISPRGMAGFHHFREWESDDSTPNLESIFRSGMIIPGHFLSFPGYINRLI